MITWFTDLEYGLFRLQVKKLDGGVFTQVRDALNIEPAKNEKKHRGRGLKDAFSYNDIHLWFQQ